MSMTLCEVLRPIFTTMKTKLYILCESSGEIRYIGKTVRQLEARLRRHIQEAESYRDNSYRCNWIRALLARGSKPTIILIGETSGDGCGEEVAWIAYGRQEGWRLTNRTDGGDGVPGYKHTDQTKEKMRMLHLGKKRSPHSDQTKLKMRLSRLGTICSAEARKNMSLSHIGYKQTEEHVENARLTRVGTKRSVETRTIQSIIRKQRLSLLSFDERKALVRNALKSRGILT
jgi:hypothetical protein